jgi:hypothetical protein
MAVKTLVLGGAAVLLVIWLVTIIWINTPS